MRSLLDTPTAESRAHFRDRIPRFLLTVDTEEEFDWNKPLTRDTHGIEHVGRLAKFQAFCERQKVVPVYLVDWPIANAKLAADILREPLAQGLAEIGVQLHPWVNPPFEEDVTQANSFAGNLPRDLEAAKLGKLRDTIEANFGIAPLIYRAGRYGAGPNTADILTENGIAVDTSVRPKFDYTAAGGPDYREHPVHPYWVDDEHTLLELPLTTSFWGMLRRQGDYIYPRLWRAPVMRGVAVPHGPAGARPADARGGQRQ